MEADSAPPPLPGPTPTLLRGLGLRHEGVGSLPPSPDSPQHHVPRDGGKATKQLPLPTWRRQKVSLGAFRRWPCMAGEGSGRREWAQEASSGTEVQRWPLRAPRAPATGCLGHVLTSSEQRLELGGPCTWSQETKLKESGFYLLCAPVIDGFKQLSALPSREGIQSWTAQSVVRARENEHFSLFCLLAS